MKLGHKIKQIMYRIRVLVEGRYRAQLVILPNIIYQWV